MHVVVFPSLVLSSFPVPSVYFVVSCCAVSCCECAISIPPQLTNNQPTRVFMPWSVGCTTHTEGPPTDPHESNREGNPTSRTGLCCSRMCVFLCVFLCVLCAHPPARGYRDVGQATWPHILEQRGRLASTHPSEGPP